MHHKLRKEQKELSPGGQWYTKLYCKGLLRSVQDDSPFSAFCIYSQRRRSWVWLWAKEKELLCGCSTSCTAKNQNGLVHLFHKRSLISLPATTQHTSAIPLPRSLRALQFQVSRHSITVGFQDGEKTIPVLVLLICSPGFAFTKVSNYFPATLKTWMLSALIFFKLVMSKCAEGKAELKSKHGKMQE